MDLASVLLPLADAAPAAGGSSSATAIVVAALSAGGLGAILAAVVGGLFSKRKLGAEATEIITKAAAGVVTDLRSELDRIVLARKADQAEHEKTIEEMAAAHVKERGEFMRVLQLHVAWDAIAIAKLGELGVELPPAPPLTPARRFVDDQGHPL
jgi:uncharacterized membrane protein YebE (DUF533 family)